MNEKVYPEWEFKTALLRKHLEFNSTLAEYYKITQLRGSESPMKKNKVIELALDLYFNLLARIKKNKYNNLQSIMQKKLAGEDLGINELLEAAGYFSDLFLKEGIEKIGMEKGDPNSSML